MGGIRLHTLLAVAVPAIGIITLLPFAWLGTDTLTLSYREASVRDLTANARLLAMALPGQIAEDGRDAVASLARAARVASGARYTVIRRDGSVLADSDEDSARMENHLNRPEVKTALAGGTGLEIRRSPTLGDDWIYVALPLADGNILRAATSQAELDDRLRLWWKKGLYGLLMSLGVLLCLAAGLARKLSRPLEAAAAGAERYAAGDFSFRVPAAGAREMRRLAGAMGAMAKQLDSRFRLITRQREEMETVFENMSEGILAADESGMVMLSNTAAEKMLGIDKSAAGRYIGTAIRNADLLDALRQAATAEAPLEKEIRIRPGDGREEAILLAHAARIAEGDRKAGVLAVLRDVTQLRRLEVMRRDFVANVSHELRTPITAIQSCLETLLEGGAASGENAAFLDMALRNARRLGAIVGNLLFLAGMESNSRAESEAPASHPVRPVLDEAVLLCADAARERGTACEIDCEDDLTALMNPRLIAHAVVNLVDNAIKYGPENGVINIAARRNGDATEIVVSDHGPGIAPHHQSRVFERFYRVDGITRVKKGSGLGLAIVKHIALSQGGDIRVESEIGIGSTFRLSLPNNSKFP